MDNIKLASRSVRSSSLPEIRNGICRRAYKAPVARFASPIRLKSVAVLLAGLAFGACASLQADTYLYSGIGRFSPAGEIKKANTDTASKAFYGSDLKSMSHLVGSKDLLDKSTLPPNSNGKSWVSLDPAKLTLNVSQNVRAYFVGEDTAYHNSLGFNINGKGADPRDALIIFPDASTNVSWNNATNPPKKAERTSSAPLFPGDFVDLGRIDKGKTLDFFLIANGRNASSGSTPPVLGAKNMVAFTQVDNPYLLIGFEDGSGTVDYSDAMFALDIGAANISGMITASSSGVPAPEPGLISLVVVGIGGVLNALRRRRNRKVDTTGLHRAG